MPHVASICLTPASVDPRPAGRYARVPVAEAVLVVGHGLAGDVKGRRGRRQLNVLTAEAVDRLRADGFRAGPGELGEQLVVAGLDVDALTPGSRLAVGDAAVIEVTLPRTGCRRFAAVHGRPKDAADGRLGVMARVVRGGVVRVGDVVTRPAS